MSVNVELPFDLERKIFEISARESQADACRLVLVARRVNAWIYPILYATVMLRRRRDALKFLAVVEAKPFLASRVKTLIIYSTVGYWQAGLVLATCTTVDRLSCWVSDPRLRPSLAPYRVKRLSFMLSGFSYATENISPDFANPFYNQVTHLHFTDSWVSWVTWTGFHLLPKITHIAFVYDDTSLADDLRVANAIRDTLSQCSSLTLLVLLHTRRLSMAFALIVDSRFVSIPFSRHVTRISGSLVDGTGDLWMVAEEQRYRD